MDVHGTNIFWEESGWGKEVIGTGIFKGGCYVCIAYFRNIFRHIRSKIGDL